MIKITLKYLVAFIFIAIASFSVGGVNVSAETAGTISGKTTSDSKILERANKEIEVRITSLNQLSTKIQLMKKLSDVQKSNFSTQISNLVSELSALKIKIAGETDKAVLKTDVASITKAYRIFALIEPQIRITASADRIISTVALFQTINLKLSAKMSEAQNAGNDVTEIVKLFADMTGKSTSAQAKAEEAINSIIVLKPDNGDKTIAASNKLTLKEARGLINDAHDDLKQAREDAKKILESLKAFSKK